MRRKQLLGMRGSYGRKEDAMTVNGVPRTASARLIDRDFPRADHGGRHETLVHAPADLVLEVAWNLDMRSSPAARAIVWLRGKLLRG
jgi:hypothetical protein